ncbi:phage terminase large subunit [Niabella insulamsoli]|uniref:phage terminase large subunit n=1 Tax=Niabella insulamsoli TaxID=3144874 RepID=UPI0031FC50DE
MAFEEVEIEIDNSVYLDCYHHLLEDNDIDIELVWGGRDSGKSHFVGQKSVEDSFTLDYFRCILIKETHEAIRDSQVAMIQEIVEDWQLDDLFDVLKQPLEIRCINQNKFLARGTDKPGKLRSITNPSHVWIEEGNQLTETAFITILTSLRNKYGRVKLWISFNPEATCPDYVDFWLYKTFFAKYYPRDLSFTSELVIDVPGKDPVKLKYRSTHTTYKDNPFVSPQRVAFHEALKDLNYHWYQVFTLGLWGNQENDCPWLFAFNRKVHVAEQELHATKKEVLFLSWDFNRNPMVCTVMQNYNDTLYIIDVIKVKNVGTEGLCEIVLTKYPGFLYMVTGDYSGDTASSLYKEQVTNFTLIKSMLKLSDGQIKISPNPRLEKNQTLVNTVFHSYKVLMCPVKAKPAIYDAENVKKRPDGTIVKDNRDDPAQQADVLDTIRYWINQFMGWFIKK